MHRPVQPEHDKDLFFSRSQNADSRCLSNFCELDEPLLIDGHRYATVEHFYQAEKFRHIGDDAGALNFTNEAPKSKYVGWSGAAAKRASKPASGKLGHSWWGDGAEKDQVMIKALNARACVDKNFVRVLLAAHSQQRQLRHYEPARRGETSYWGCARNARGGFEGRNVLGRMLMDLAKRLASDRADAEAKRIAAELKKVERKLREIDQLKQRLEQGEQLEKNQLAKIDRETQWLHEKALLDQESTEVKPDVVELVTDIEQPAPCGYAAREPMHVAQRAKPAVDAEACDYVASEPVHVAAVPVDRRARPRGGQSHFSRKYRKDHTVGGA